MIKYSIKITSAVVSLFQFISKSLFQREYFQIMENLRGHGEEKAKLLWKLSPTLFTGFRKSYNPYLQVVRMFKMSWLEKAESVCGDDLQWAMCAWQHSRVYCDDFTHKLLNN